MQAAEEASRRMGEAAGAAEPGGWQQSPSPAADRSSQLDISGDEAFLRRGRHAPSEGVSVIHRHIIAGSMPCSGFADLTRARRILICPQCRIASQLRSQVWSKDGLIFEYQFLSSPGYRLEQNTLQF